MDYITLDLEWNQAYLQQALAVQKRIGCHQHGERSESTRLNSSHAT